MYYNFICIIFHFIWAWFCVLVFGHVWYLMNNCSFHLGFPTDCLDYSMIILLLVSVFISRTCNISILWKSSPPSPCPKFLVFLRGIYQKNHLRCALYQKFPFSCGGMEVVSGDHFCFFMWNEMCVNIDPPHSKKIVSCYLPPSLFPKPNPMEKTKWREKAILVWRYDSLHNMRIPAEVEEENPTLRSMNQPSTKILRGLVVFIQKNLQKALKPLVSMKHGRLGCVSADQMVFFLIKVAALNLVPRLSCARCPFIWNCLQASQILCYTPF